MIRPIPFANALTLTATGLFVVLIGLREVAPAFFVYFFNAQFFGADVASLLPARPGIARLLGDLLIMLVGAWLFGYCWAFFYNRWTK
ncbi:MAG: hypothetical protein EPO61_04865 [Nitrospirae bacterium]|nr:MAG: hypothetical protein EPO61_04865 [Nitrospirota bacterium]